MEPVMRNVNDLKGRQRRWLEEAAGQPLGENQQFFVIVYTSGAPPDQAVRAQGAAELHQILDQSERHARDHNVRGSQAGAAVDEAMHHVR